MKKKHLGKARFPAVILLAALALVVFARIQSEQRATVRASMLYLLPTPAELALALHRVGLDADALAAAGLSAGATSTVVSEVRDHLVTNQASLELAVAACADLKRQSDQLKRLVQSGTATSQQISDYAVAKGQLAQAQSQRQSALDALFDAGTASLSQSQRDTLAAIRSNRDWGLPLEFLVFNRTEPDWVHLRDCLANERIAAALDEDPDAGAQADLAQFRSTQFVAAAKANLDANAAVVKSAWEQAIRD